MEQNAVILAVNYPRYPVASVKHIERAVDDFWNYFYSQDLLDDCNAKVPGLTVDRKALMVSGESAGGYVALYSVVHPHRDFEAKLLWLRYPMLEHYLRIDDHKPSLAFMGHPQNKEDARKHGDALWETTQAIREDMIKAGLLSTDDPSIFADIFERRTPPYGMGSAFVSSWVGTWSNYFAPEGKNRSDILTELVNANRKGGLGPKKAPALLVYHGVEDVNVPIRISETLAKNWPKMFSDEDTTTKTNFIRVEHQGHGFDYTILGEDVLEGKDEDTDRGKTTMNSVLDFIGKHW